MSMNDKWVQFTSRIKFVKIHDVLAIFPMIVGCIIAQPIKLFHKNIWLVCERKGEARDNGYWFFKYMCEDHPEIETIYAIDKSAPDYKKVASIGKVIQFGSLLHWIYYFAAAKNISSQKEGKPNAALCYVLEVYFGARKNRVYLKHGIVKDSQRWIYYDVTKLNLICCAAFKEYDFIKQVFGYPDGNVVLTGLCRFDNLLAPHGTKKQILIMPTMREWLRTISSETLKYEKTDDFCQSEYFVTWKSLLENQSLCTLLDTFGYDLIFYPHPAMQKYVSFFETKSDHIRIANDKQYDIQTLLMESSFLITDYSSIYFDFAYMLKPLAYYQFDYDKYRKGQYQEGYFSYETDGFGPVITTENELINYLELHIDNLDLVNPIYLNRMESFYAFRDNKNCERTYMEITRMN